MGKCLSGKRELKSAPAKHIKNTGFFFGFVYNRNRGSHIFRTSSFSLEKVFFDRQGHLRKDNLTDKVTLVIQSGVRLAPYPFSSIKSQGEHLLKEYLKARTEISHFIWESLSFE